MLNQLKDKITLAALTVPAYAATNVSEGTGGNIQITASGNAEKLSTLTAGGIISGAISLVMILVSIIFFFILVMGGLKWVTSGGDEKKVAAARAQITNGLIGMAIVFAAYAIMRLIGTVFGINVFNLAIPTLTGQ